jgi:H/ACA ribonucleoprotein complex subunit 4
MSSLQNLLSRKPLVVVNKPPGPTSHQVVDYTKDILGVDKAGHGGTLDPNVTGVLPVATQRYTRITHALLDSTKEYVCLAYFHDDITSEQLHQLIDDYTGEITQTPPVKSSVKREPRQRTIQAIDVLDKHGQEALLRINCDGGTYIRKLIDDMGGDHGPGAHMQELHRARAGPFHIDQAVNLHELSDYAAFYENGETNILEDYMLPLKAGVDHLPKIYVDNGCVEPLSHGSYLKAPGIQSITGEFHEDGMVAVLHDDELILIGEAATDSDALRSAEGGVAVRTTQVYRQPTSNA